MILGESLKKSVQDSVLCWLATSFNDQPNVSPKEIFKIIDEKIIIANIASPTSLKNIEKNHNVCVSFIDILSQKGWKVQGKGLVLKADDERFRKYKMELERMTDGKFPFHSIFEINPHSCNEIKAPSYLFFPETTEESQIEAAKKMYGI